MNSDSAGPVVAFPSLDRVATIHDSARLMLDGRTVHLWGFSLDGSAAVLKCCRIWLSEQERERAARFFREEDQTRYILAHGGLRAVLARYTGLDPAALQFQAGSTGKPILLDQQGCTHALCFNLSHSHGRMLIAVAQGQEVGVDLERMRDKVDVIKLAKRFYTPSEYQEIAGRSGFDQRQQFYHYWVAKEAVLKGRGVGILSLRKCEILTQDDTSRYQVDLFDGTALSQEWTIQWLACGTGWQGAVALLGKDWNVSVQTAVSEG